MSSSNLVRIGGLAAVLAGALLLIGDVWNLLLEFLSPETENFSDIAITTTWTVLSSMMLIGVLLLLVALTGLYARQSEAAGALGLAGFLVALVGTGLLAGMMWAFAFVVPSAAIEAPAFLNNEETAGPLDLGFMLSGIAVGVGWALCGIATFRARVFPRVAAIVLIVGALIAIAPLPATPLLIELAVIWLGVDTLRAERRAPSTAQVGAEAQPGV